MTNIFNFQILKSKTSNIWVGLESYNLKKNMWLYRLGDGIFVDENQDERKYTSRVPKSSDVISLEIKDSKVCFFLNGENLGQAFVSSNFILPARVFVFILSSSDKLKLMPGSLR